jgi:hypothetical protein
MSLGVAMQSSHMLQEIFAYPSSTIIIDGDTGSLAQHVNIQR